MKSPEWKTYRTRFLVKAKQLTSTLSFTDHLGRQHCGRKGDYLVESYEGVLSIAPRHIFEDIYVQMSGVQMSALDQAADVHSFSDDTTTASESTHDLNPAKFESLRVERICESKFRFRANDSLSKHSPVSSRARRKSPQPVRDSATRVGLM